MLSKEAILGITPKLKMHFQSYELNIRPKFNGFLVPSGPGGVYAERWWSY